MLRSVLSPNKVYVQFKHDALERRIAKIVGDTIYRYIWDGDVRLHERHYKLSDRPSLVVNEDLADKLIKNKIELNKLMKDLLPLSILKIE